MKTNCAVAVDADCAAWAGVVQRQRTVGVGKVGRGMGMHSGYRERKGRAPSPLQRVIERKSRAEGRQSQNLQRMQRTKRSREVNVQSRLGVQWTPNMELRRGRVRRHSGCPLERNRNHANFSV